MIDIQKLLADCEFHIKRGDNMVMPPKLLKELAERLAVPAQPVQPPASMVRELFEALRKAESAMTWEIGGEPCGLQTALIAVRAALAKAKEHGL